MSQEATMHLTREELQSGALEGAKLAAAVRTLRDSGMVVLEDLLDQELVAELRAAYEDQLERHIAAKGGMDGMNQRAFGSNHIGMFLPMVPPFSDVRVIANPIMVQVLEQVIGADFRCSFYHSNTSYPGSGHQPVHRDNQPLFGVELGVPHPPVAIVVNVPLCDFTEENGSTEVWPGSHLIVDDQPEQAKELEARVAHLASVRTNVRAGSIVLRDLRTWHRGMPNNASYPRTMLAPVYTRGWLHAATQCEIPRAIWEAWPERVRQIFRGNPVVEEVPDLAGVTLGDLAAQGRLRR
jgi:ectoine hydroxylase-related dioxygenase (phytanoyl-CoA dioxygenase family)